ncbi:hypothetical protein [Paraglaciecola aestuariivivens]
MKVAKIVVFLGTAITLIGTANAGSRVEQQVHVGGPDATSLCVEGDNTCDKNFSLTGLVLSDGRIKGNYVDRFAGESKGFSARVDCVSIIDNQAWISAVVKKGTYSDLDIAGMRVTTMVVDNGKNNKSPYDQISFSYLVNDEFSCYSQPDLPLFDMPKGQVSIK